MDQVKGKNTSNYNPQRPTLNRARVRERTKAHRRRLKKAAAAALLLLGVCVGHSVARSVARSLAVLLFGGTYRRLFCSRGSGQHKEAVEVEREEREVSLATTPCVHVCTLVYPPKPPRNQFRSGLHDDHRGSYFCPAQHFQFHCPLLPPLFSALSIRNLAPTTEWGFPRVKFVAQLVF